MTNAALENALRLRRAGKLAEAAEAYATILAADPKNFEALHALGIVRYQCGQIDEAEKLFGAAVAVEPRAADAVYNRACLLQKLGRLEEALGCFAQAIALKPGYVEALTNRGGALMQLARYEEANADFDAVIAKAPNLPQAWNNRGSALTKLKRLDEALLSFDRALALKPDYADALKNRGVVYLLQQLPEKALADFDKALALDPRSWEAWEYKGNALSHLNPADAIASYDRALGLKPDHPDLLSRRANVLLSSRRFEEAVTGYRQLLARDPDFDCALGNLGFCLLNVCDWPALEALRPKLETDLREGKRACAPFTSIALAPSAAEILAASRLFAAAENSSDESPQWRGPAYGHDRPRIAYLSANFNDHAVARLMAGVFESHDKSRFETIAVSFGKDRGALHQRLRGAFERFIDVRGKSDAETARLLRELEIDIAVDLMGYTEFCRPGILAFRAAPVQVNYLGFPATMGAEHIDYIIADQIVLEPSQQPHYSEKVAYLPDCYLPNDSRRTMTASRPMRAAIGLPEHGFVFCSFNQPYKFAPHMFDVWMRLLRNVAQSVLWLPSASQTAVQNLAREAEKRGVPENRLVFAPFTASVEDHLARLQCADLFLDTLPYNSHSSACDALFAGVPIITCLGSSFAGRVAASVLSAAGLPELVTTSLSAYETLALELARDPSRLSALKAKIVRSRETSALFDTVRFTRHLESAFTTMVDRFKRGEPPQSFAVQP